MAWAAVAGAAIGVVGGALMGGGGGSSAPAADPGVSAAAAANAQVAADTLAFNKQVYANNQPRVAAMDALNSKVINQQIAVGDVNQAQAQDQWSRFKTQFVPVEDQMVSDAMTIDSAANQEQAAGDAGSQVAKSYDATQQQTARNLASMGINPNSGRALAATATLDSSKAADTAGSMNNARQIVKDKGITLRAGAANFGRNMPNTAANSYGITLNAGNNAVNNSSAGITAANSNVAQMNSGFNTAISGNNSAGSILNSKYGNQINAWNGQQQADATSSAGLGNMVGTLGSAYLNKYGSSKKIKDRKTKIDHGDTLDKVKDLPVENWHYKKGIADQGEHIGAYAEDVQKSFGDKAAPGGKAIDMISMNGITLSAIKGLAKTVDKLESKVSKLAARGTGRD